MNKEKLIDLLKALPDNSEIILFTEEGDLRNDFELELASQLDFDTHVPVNDCFVLIYGYDSVMFHQTFKTNN